VKIIIFCTCFNYYFRSR